jgi:hypothetical protein
MRKSLVLTIVFVFACGVTLSSIMASAQEDYNIPAWIKNNAAWWSQGQIDDASFVNGIKYMIENGIMEITQGDNQVVNDDLYQENQELSSLLAEYQEANDGFAESEKAILAEIDSLKSQLSASDELVRTITEELAAAQQNVSNTGSSVQKIQDNGDFFVVYLEPTTAFAIEQEQIIQNWGYFEEQVEWLNATFSLPYDVGIVLTECEFVNALYDEEVKAVYMCYELMTYLDDLFFEHLDGDVESAVNESGRVTDFIFYHEIGHALIDVYELPTTGPEEDAADSFSSYIMADLTESTTGQDSIFSAGTWFLIEHDNYGVSESAFWDTHSLSIQRYYNTACFSYGSNPTYNQDLVDEGWLPSDRAVWCDEEYTQQSNSWAEILQPFFK